jgi:hypothetical protein
VTLSTPSPSRRTRRAARRPLPEPSASYWLSRSRAVPILGEPAGSQVAKTACRARCASHSPPPAPRIRRPARRPAPEPRAASCRLSSRSSVAPFVCWVLPQCAVRTQLRCYRRRRAPNAFRATRNIPPDRLAPNDAGRASLISERRGALGGGGGRCRARTRVARICTARGQKGEYRGQHRAHCPNRYRRLAGLLRGHSSRLSFRWHSSVV